MSVVTLRQKHPVWSEASICHALCRQTFQSRCVLLVDNCFWTGYEADVLAVTTDLRLIDIEIKISRADLKADAGKDKWWHRMGFGSWDPETHKYREAPAVHRDWPVRVWKHYYAMPAEVWMDELLPALGSPKSGVLTLSQDDTGRVRVDCVRRATPNRDAQKLRAEQVMDIARLANLRMWDAYDTMRKRPISSPATATDTSDGG